MNPPATGLPSFMGQTGLLNVPDALVAPEGTVFLGYDTQVDPRWAKAPWQENYLMGFGWGPYMEGGLRVAHVPRGLMDLSAQVKVQLPWGPGWGPRIAFGAQDFRGAAAYYKTKYAVATQDLGPLRVSLGYGRGPDILKGTFGGAELRVTDWFQLLADSDTKHRNAGIRLALPPAWLPERMNVGVLVKRTLGKVEDGARRGTDLMAYARIPLGRSYSRTAVPEPAAKALFPAAPQTVAPVPPPVPLAGAGADPQVMGGGTVAPGLQGALVAHGFENVKVGRVDGSVVVRCENSRYNRTELDGLGVILGMAASRVPAGTEKIRVELMNHGLVVFALEAPTGPLRDFFQVAESEAPLATARLAERLQVTAPGLGVTRTGTVWEGAAEGSSLLRPRIQLYPVLSSRVATDYGTFDHRLSMVPDVFLQLWPGAGLQARWDLPVSWTQNYREGRPYHDRPLNNRLDRLMLQQTLRVLPGLTTQVAVGQYEYGEKGVMNQTVWAPGDGTHQFMGTFGRLRNDAKRERQVSLGAYRLSLPNLDSFLQLSYGDFAWQDRGTRLDIGRRFGDITVTGFLSRTTYVTSAYTNAGFTIALPLTPRRDMRPGLVQLRGTPSWRWGLSSILVKKGDANTLTPGLADMPGQAHGLVEEVLDQGRLNEAHLKANLLRLREAWLAYGRQ